MQHVVLDAVRQRLLVARLRAPLLGAIISSSAVLGRHLAVDGNDTVVHLDVVAWQANHPFDVVRRVVAGQPEDDHVAALWRATVDTTFEGEEAPREGVAAVSIRELRDE